MDGWTNRQTDRQKYKKKESQLGMAPGFYIA